MKEYLLLDLVFLAAVIAADTVLHTKLFLQKRFWLFQLLVFLLTTVTNGYSASRPFVLYNRAFLLNIRIFSIPPEDYLVGFNLITLNLVLFETVMKKRLPKV